MKSKKIFNAAVIFLVIAFTLSGCMEHRYYQQNHRHTTEYYGRHHMTPPPEVDVRIHN